MIDHTGVSVSDFQKSKAFYQKALAPIGYALIMELPASVTGSATVTAVAPAPHPRIPRTTQSPRTDRA